VSLADKTDTVTGLFAAGERPTGTRDPFGLRRQMHGLLKVLVDLPELTGLRAVLDLDVLVRRAADAFGAAEAAAVVADVRGFALDRLRHLFGQRGFRPDEIEAALGATAAGVRPLIVRWQLDALRDARVSQDFEALAVLFKRVKNIAREISAEPQASYGSSLDRSLLTTPAEQQLLAEYDVQAPAIGAALAAGDYRRAVAAAATMRPAVDRFFTDVFVMADDEKLRTSRLMLMVSLRDLVLSIADISQLAPAGA
jgi:glycyl-tRNA synthetase beta chain